MKLNDQALLKAQAYINGDWVSAGTSFEVRNPATGDVLATLPDMGAEETRAAIDAAETAFKSWRKMLAKERSAILQKWFRLIMDAQEDLAQILTAEMGKPLTESRGEIAYGASFIEWFAEEGKRVYGDVIPSPQPDRRIMVIKQPIGVVGAITPWNFPNAMITRKVAPALAVGCTMVVKPAAETPLSALALAELADRAGVPKGVFNVVVGKKSRDIGGELCSNQKVRKLTFTGSTEVGRVLMRQCSDDIKKMSLELGGNAPFIVFDDADIDAAVDGAMASKYRNSGQTCVCANRLYVQDGIYDAFVDKLAAKVAAMKVGDGTEDGVVQGPLINDEAIEKVEEHIADALAKGGELVLGGKRHELGGSFFEPTLIRNVTKDMKVAREETFGPVAPVFRFTDEADVIAQANDTEFGLASYFYARDLARVWRVAEELEYGMVGINTGILSTEVAPFGGVKQSGLGREGSKYGIEDYIEMKYLCMAGV
ncbi:NADP-dependent succinate-semialdehyde dehydrogenase [Kordiimonas aestuarii]|uniref:NADP-dependent succinate-semialdehyde dehydrogenase n=1 Tax=Kordiimonas aestuarii TaxID=1005925 RepID=UPI0021D2D800|nr:NADP-dependent succinate-semialdehyde dehydrogenase [Kordiimonas aestuarii]